MASFLLNPDLIGTAVLGSAVAMAMALYVSPRIGRWVEHRCHHAAARGHAITQRFAFSFSRLVTMWSGLLAGLAVLWAWGWNIDFFWQHHSLIEQMLVGGAAATLLGLVKDAFGLRRHQLIAGQCLLAMLLISSGWVVRHVSHTEWSLALGPFGFPVTMAWLVLTVNAATFWRKPSGWTIAESLLVLGTVFVFAVSQLYLSVALWCCLLCGSLIGMLVFHAPRWSAALGTTGTMVVAVQTSILAVHAASSGPSEIPLNAGMLLAAVPLLVLVSVFAKTAVSQPATAIAPSRTTTSPISAAKHTSPAARPRSSNKPVKPPESKATELSPDESGILQVSGNRDWSSLWETLCALGKHLDLSEFEMQVSIPSLNEAWHGRRRRYKHRDKDPQWRVETPLYVGEHHVGRLVLAGMSRNESQRQWIGRVTAGLRPFEIHLLAVMETHAHLPTSLKSPPPLEQRVSPTALAERSSDDLPPIIRRHDAELNRGVYSPPMRIS